MTPGTTPPPLEYREYRRLRAYELKEQGWKQKDIKDIKDIAAALGVTEGAVSQWLKRAREEGGRGALRRRPPPGPRPRLTPEQLSSAPSCATCWSREPRRPAWKGMSGRASGSLPSFGGSLACGITGRISVGWSALSG